MKKEKKIIYKRSLIIIGVLLGTMLMLTGCGKAEISVKTYDKENEAEIQKVGEVVENTVKKSNTITEKKEEKTTNGKSDDVEDFSSNDLKLRGITFGSSLKNVVNEFGIEYGTKDYEEGASGNSISEIMYDDGLVIAVINDGEDGSVYWMNITEASLLKTSRGIKIGDTHEDILKAYPSNSVLENEGELVVVGFPGDTDEYASKGRIYFHIKNGKVTKIGYYNTYAE